VIPRSFPFSSLRLGSTELCMLVSPQCRKDRRLTRCIALYSVPCRQTTDGILLRRLSWISHHADPLRALKARSRLAASPVMLFLLGWEQHAHAFFACAWYMNAGLIPILESGDVKSRSMWRDSAMDFTEFGKSCVRTTSVGDQWKNTLTHILHSCLSASSTC
jgi:hypothetical protein